MTQFAPGFCMKQYMDMVGIMIPLFYNYSVLIADIFEYFLQTQRYLIIDGLPAVLNHHYQMVMKRKYRMIIIV